MTASVQAAVRVVADLVAAGVRDVVLSPGSRSAPVAYVVAAAERDGRLRLHVRHDERSAAFLGLGIGRADPAHPAVVVTTSGSAVGHLLPAAMEARHAGVPLIFLTADRPLRLRATWASQTSDAQASLLAAVAWTADVDPLTCDGSPWLEAFGAAVGGADRRPGPAHLNVCFDTPLEPTPDEAVSLPTSEDANQPVAPDWTQGPPASPPGSWGYEDGRSADLSPAPSGRGKDVSGRAATLPDLPDSGPSRATWKDVASGRAATLPLGPRTVVVAGDGAGPEASELAAVAGWPLLAEPTSGARYGPARVDAYRLVLAQLADQVERVVVYGRPTVSRPVTALLEDPRVELVQVVRHPDDPGPARPAQRVEAVRVDEPDDPAWLSLWLGTGRARLARALATVDAWPRVTGLSVAHAVAAATRAGSGLYVGASNPVRDLDLVAGDLPRGALVAAGRGLAGIDGAISTATGLAVASGLPTRAYLGDLTFLHDLAGLAVPAQERSRLRLQVVVANDNGGGIFATLEHAHHPVPFERVFGTPTGADLGALCAGYGVSHRLVTVDELPAALAQVPEGISVVEVTTDRTDLGALHAAL